MNFLSLFEREKHPIKFLFAYEKVMAFYLIATLLLVLFMYTALRNPAAMLETRLQIAVITLALWGIYRVYPCAITRLLRAVGQCALLSLWYPDTYEINSAFPNLDHIFAEWEQDMFGFQPALVFAKNFSYAWFSELMHLGYSSYYPMIGVVGAYYFFLKRKNFDKALFIILTSFFIYYVIFIILPVTGPQYYYLAVGEDVISAGHFPDVKDYFLTHSERMTTPGWSEGFFYGLVEHAHEAGERPTAAFPSSHVGITTILMLLAWQTRSRKFFYFLLPFFILMFFATVYIKAHYAVDAIAGLLSGVAIYFVLLAISTQIKLK